MKKKIWLYVLIAGLLLLSACSEGEETKSSGKQEANSVEENTEMEALIGEQIEVAEDGSIELPFHDQVLAAAYSKDGHIKLFGFDGFVIIVEGDEIIYAEEHSSKYHLDSHELTVSEDGRFVAWRGHMEDFEISVYDVENKVAHLVEKTDDLDPYIIFAPFLIEKHGDTYYLMSNDYLAAIGFGHNDKGSIVVIDLNNMELTDDRKITKKLIPEKPIEDDDTYHNVRAEAAEMGLEEGYYSEYGYYNYFYDAEEVGEDDQVMSLTKLYGNVVEKGLLKEIKIEDMEFGKDEINVMNYSEFETQRIQVADNGMFLLPVVDGDVEENDYTLSVYVADLTEENPVATLVTKEEVTDVRPSMFFNEDATAIYVSKEGMLEKYDIK